MDLYIKSQNTSTKIQINLKSQYSMTKTFIKVVLHRLANPGLTVMMPLELEQGSSLLLTLNSGIFIK
jgi:hypothetical protein